MSQPDLEHRLCESLVEKHLSTSPIVLFLLDALRKAGCPYGRGAFRCVPCRDVDGGGAFDPTQGIRICEDGIQSAAHVQDTLAHELLHAFDYCRIDFDLDNCRHRACSEIRAANLSGDCRWSRELLRGNWSNIKEQHKVCVERRARKSLENADACRGCNVGDVIRQVWPSCLADTAPFVDIP